MKFTKYSLSLLMITAFTHFLAANKQEEELGFHMLNYERPVGAIALNKEEEEKIRQKIKEKESVLAKEDQIITIFEEIKSEFDDSSNQSLLKPFAEVTARTITKKMINDCYLNTLNLSKIPGVVGGFGTFPGSDKLPLEPLWKAFEANSEIARLKSLLETHKETLGNKFIYCLYCERNKLNLAQ